MEEGDFAFHSILPQGASLSQSIANNAKVEKILLQFPEVEQVVGRTGSAEIPTDPMPPEATDLMIVLKDKDEWTTAHDRESLQDTMLQALRQVPGVFYEATQPIQMRFNELMTGIRQDVAVKIYGENMDTLAVIAEQVAGIIGEVQGAGEPQVEKVVGLPQITVTYDRNRVAQYGLNIRELNRTLRTAFAGEASILSCAWHRSNGRASMMCEPSSWPCPVVDRSSCNRWHVWNSNPAQHRSVGKMPSAGSL